MYQLSLSGGKSYSYFLVLKRGVQESKRVAWNFVLRLMACCCIGIAHGLDVFMHILLWDNNITWACTSNVSACTSVQYQCFNPCYCVFEEKYMP